MGPFQTERDAIDAALAWLGQVTSDDPNLAMLLNACFKAGVVPGAYDQRIIEWLAGFEPQTVAVIAGLITRAHNASSHLTGISSSEEG